MSYYSLRSKAKKTVMEPVETTSNENADLASNVFSSFLAEENDEKEPTLRDVKEMLMAMMKQMLKVDLMNCDIQAVKTQQKLILSNMGTLSNRIDSVEKRVEEQGNNFKKALAESQ